MILRKLRKTPEELAKEISREYLAQFFRKGGTVQPPPVSPKPAVIKPNPTSIKVPPNRSACYGERISIDKKGRKRKRYTVTHLRGNVSTFACGLKVSDQFVINDGIGPLDDCCVKCWAMGNKPLEGGE